MNTLEKLARGVLAVMPALGVVATIVGGTASATLLAGPQPAPADPRAGSIVSPTKRIDSVQLMPASLRDRIGPALPDSPGASVSDKQLDTSCGDWFVTWDEDAAGQPVSHSLRLHCGAGAPIPLG